MCWICAAVLPHLLFVCKLGCRGWLKRPYMGTKALMWMEQSPCSIALAAHLIAKTLLIRLSRWIRIGNRSKFQRPQKQKSLKPARTRALTFWGGVRWSSLKAVLLTEFGGPSCFLPVKQITYLPVQYEIYCCSGRHWKAYSGKGTLSWLCWKDAATHFWWGFDLIGKWTVQKKMKFWLIH